MPAETSAKMMSKSPYQKRAFLTLVWTSTCLYLGIHPLGLWTPWAAFIPLFLLAFDPRFPGIKVLDTSLLGLCLLIGSAYFAAGLYWITYFNSVAYAGILLLMAPLFAVYFLGVRQSALASKNDFIRILSSGLIWILMHQAYSFLPVGTIGLDIPFYGPDSFLQILSYFSYSAVGAVILMMNASIAVILEKKNCRTASFMLGVSVLLLICLHVWGSGRLAKPVTHLGTERPLKVSLIQHNLPIEKAGLITEKGKTFSVYEQMAREALQGNPDLIIFPLYDLTVDVLKEPNFFTDLARKIGKHILLATYIADLRPDGTRGDTFRDMAILYSPEGKVAGTYQAFKPPPFAHSGETPSPRYKVMDSPFGKIGILLCYEDGLAYLTRQAVNQGAEFLIALSNPGQFTGTWLPHYHLIQDRMRAIESRRTLVRVNANGYSAVIDAYGKVIERSRLNKKQILHATLRRNS